MRKAQGQPGAVMTTIEFKAPRNGGMSRRDLLQAVSGLALSAAFLRLPPKPAETGFVEIDGWILLKSDLA